MLAALRAAPLAKSHAGIISACRPTALRRLHRDWALAHLHRECRWSIRPSFETARWQRGSRPQATRCSSRCVADLCKPNVTEAPKVAIAHRGGPSPGADVAAGSPVPLRPNPLLLTLGNSAAWCCRTAQVQSNRGSRICRAGFRACSELMRPTIGGPGGSKKSFARSFQSAAGCSLRNFRNFPTPLTAAAGLARPGLCPLRPCNLEL